jgi:hypothetical protein
MDKEFAEVFQEEIVNEGKIEELGKQIAGLAHKFKEGKDDVMTMADEMITNGSMPDPEMIKMLETEEADMVIHLIAKKMGVQWTKDNGYGEMRFKQNYPESTDMVMGILGKKKVEINEMKWEVGVVYHQDFGGGEISYFRADSLLKNKRWKGMAVDEYGGKQRKPKNITVDEKVQGWKITPKDKIPKGLKEEVEEGIDIQKADMKDVIKDFQSSDAPQFKGKSDKKKKEMAIAAKLSKEENEDDDPVGKKKKKSNKDVINLKPTAESSMKKFKDIMTKLKEKRFGKEEVEIKEDWLEDEMREVQHRWPKTNIKIKIKWLAKITDRAKKDGMDTSAGSEFDERLNDYGLTKFPKEQVYTAAQKVKPKWKRMSTVQKTKWVDDLHDLAGKTKTSDADVESILDDAGLKIKESVEEASGGKEAYQKFFNGVLKKFGVKSPSQLKGDKKKEFFDYIDKNWTADHEEETKKEETMAKKSLKDVVSNMKEKKLKVQEAITIGGVEVGEQDFDKEQRLDHAAPNLGMTYKDYQAKFQTDGLEGPYQIDGGAYFWDKAATKWFSVETEDYVDDKRNAELNFRYTKQGTAGGGLMHNRRL